MSSDGLSERDRQVMQVASGGVTAEADGGGNSPEEAVSDQPAESDDLRERVETLEGENQALRQENEAVREELAAERKAREQLQQKFKTFAQRLDRVQQQVEGRRGAIGETELEYYATLPQDVRENKLTATEERAVIVYENWTDFAWQGQNGQWLVNTKRKKTTKNAPAQFRRDLEEKAGTNLAWNQVYRVMKKVAELSGGEAERDDSGRLHIKGGSFEYHERTNPDNTNRQTKKVLVEVPDR